MGQRGVESHLVKEDKEEFVHSRDIKDDGGDEAGSSDEESELSKLHSQDGRFITGITSLWLLIPGVYGALIASCADTPVSTRWPVALLSAWTLFTCGISTAMWRGKHINGSRLYWIDCQCAKVQFVGLIVFHAFEVGRPIALWLKIVLPIVVLSVYLAGKPFEASRKDVATSFHLTFRFIGYWWTHLALVPEEKCTMMAPLMVGLSVAYYAHIFIVWRWAKSVPGFTTRQYYTTGVIHLLILIACMGTIHAILMSDSKPFKQLCFVDPYPDSCCTCP